MNRLVVLFSTGVLLVAAADKSKKDGALVGGNLTVSSKTLERTRPDDEWCEVGTCDDDDECDEYCVHELHYEYGHCQGDDECCCGPA
ncbi:hypothetical protein AAVH_09818 [Aphelenchoides avenae]|nr:hypothetical protein AAVH_09818 [Aphelenchus avenae]